MLDCLVVKKLEMVIAEIDNVNRASNLVVAQYIAEVKMNLTHLRANAEMGSKLAMLQRG